MNHEPGKREIVVVNQAVNYLTIGICNAFSEHFKHVSLITGSIHEQGEPLRENVNISMINKWVERPASKKLLSYLIACIKVYWLLIFRYRKCEVIFISLPPMAYLMSVILPNRCSMLMWDVYPNIFKITGMKESHPVYRLWGWLNRLAFKKAYRIITIGERMADLIANYTDREKIIVSPIWSIFHSSEKPIQDENPFIKKYCLDEKFVVQYSGNIGLTHNVEALVELASQMTDEKNILFQIIGRGPRMPYLKKIVENRQLPNCEFLPFQSDEMFPYSLAAADIGVVILNQKTSKGSIPSKSYNLMSFGIPSLYIASDDSELNDYSKRFGHAECFKEDELEHAAKFIRKLRLNPELYSHYSENALDASKNFKRQNADRLVDLYLRGKEKNTSVEAL